MTVDGTYNLEVYTTLGLRYYKIILKTDGNSLSGTLKGPRGEQPFSGGTVIGNEITWSVEPVPRGLLGRMIRFVMGTYLGILAGSMGGSIERQMDETQLTFKGTGYGDAISGQVQFGSFLSGTFNGIQNDLPIESQSR